MSGDTWDVKDEWRMWRMNEECEVWMKNMKDEWIMWSMNEKCEWWMKNVEDEGRRKNLKDEQRIMKVEGWRMIISSCWGVLLTDGQTDGHLWL